MMRHDIKELIGILVRVLGGAEVSEDDVLDLEFEADGELMAALNQAYIHLLEFVHDRKQLKQRDEIAIQFQPDRIHDLAGPAECGHRMGVRT